MSHLNTLEAYKLVNAFVLAVSALNKLLADMESSGNIADKFSSFCRQPAITCHWIKTIYVIFYASLILIKKVFARPSTPTHIPINIINYFMDTLPC
jgi:hypothetical protein